MKKLNKKQSNLTDFSEKQSAYNNLNIMQRHEMVNGFAKDVINKLGKEAVSKQRENEIVKEVTFSVLIVACNVLWNHWGKLLLRKDRLRVFFDLFMKGMEEIENPSLEQLEAEAELIRQCPEQGFKFIRDKAS